MKTNAMLLAILLFGMSIAGCVGDEIVNPIDALAPIEYTFTGSDAADSVSTSNNDTLVELTMTEGDRDHPLTWSYLSVKISVNAESVVAGGARKPDANTIPAPPPELANGAANEATDCSEP